MTKIKETGRKRYNKQTNPSKHYNIGGPEMGNKKKRGVEVFKQMKERNFPQLNRELSFQSKRATDAHISEDTWIHACGILYPKEKEKGFNASGDSRGSA